LWCPSTVWKPCNWVHCRSDGADHGIGQEKANKEKESALKSKNEKDNPVTTLFLDIGGVLLNDGGAEIQLK